MKLLQTITYKTLYDQFLVIFVTEFYFAGSAVTLNTSLNTEILDVMELIMNTH